MHQWSGAYGIPGGLERWEHRCYRWRRGLEAVLLVVLAIVLAPKVLGLTEVVAGAAVIVLGLLWLALRARPRRHRRRIAVLALPLALEARKRRTSGRTDA